MVELVSKRLWISRHIQTVDVFQPTEHCTTILCFFCSVFCGLVTNDKFIAHIKFRKSSRDFENAFCLLQWFPQCSSWFQVRNIHVILAFTMVVCEKIDLETQINKEYSAGYQFLQASLNFTLQQPCSFHIQSILCSTGRCCNDHIDLMDPYV